MFLTHLFALISFISSAQLLTGVNASLIRDSLTQKRWQHSGSDVLPGHSMSPKYVNSGLERKAGKSDVEITIQEFDDVIEDYLYIPSSKDSVDETVLFWTRNGDLYVTYDQGGSWTFLRDIKGVVSVYKSDTDDHQVFVTTDRTADYKRMWVSWDRARTFSEVHLPTPPPFGGFLATMAFHPNHADWLFYTGTKDVTGCQGFDCVPATFLSKDRGKTFSKVFDGVCYWITGLKDQERKNEELVYCLEVPDFGGDDGDDDDDSDNGNGNSDDGNDNSGGGDPFELFHFKLFYSLDYFKTAARTIPELEKVLGATVVGKFAIIERPGPRNTLESFVSTDGLNYKPRKLPANVKSRQDGSTALSFDEDSLWTFETMPTKAAKKLFGTIVRSDPGGTEFVKVLENVNRGLLEGFADFDRIESIEGTAIVNVVQNPEEVLRTGARKKLQTFITHSNGALWAPLKLDAQQGTLLHLHGFTDRLDIRNKPSSPTGVGLVMGRGNTGATLGALEDASTYMSRDAGITWTEVSKRPMYWEFGDSGAIIVLVDSLEPTDTIKYSIDDGETWVDYRFSDVKVTITNLVTMPSDTSRSFILFALPPMASNFRSAVFKLDFSSDVPQCQDKDFHWWTPAHPQIQSECLLGRSISYRRKNKGAKCTVGKYFADPKKQPTTSTRIVACACTDWDYECDFNYERGPDGKCKEIVPPSTREEQCAAGSEWLERTGYRKVAASTCKNGVQLAGSWHSCSGSSSSPNKGIGLWKIFKFFFCVLLLVLVGGGVLLFVDARRRSSGFVQLGDPSERSAQALNRGKDILQQVFTHISGLWALVRTRVPFFGSRVPQDHLGFYSRMEDDDRYRVFDEDDNRFEDDESDISPTESRQPDEDVFSAENP